MRAANNTKAEASTNTSQYDNNKAKLELALAFERHFICQAEVICHAPGRVNLIGDHTDYNDGFVLPVAIDFGTDIAAKKRCDRLVRVIALDIDQVQVQFSLDDIQVDNQHSWSNYVRGTLFALMDVVPEFNGADLIVSGNVPQGAGLSSSASFEIALLKAFVELYDLSLSGVEAALIGQRAENNFVGCNCGIMDQLISALGKAGQVMLLDCRDLSVQYAPLPEQLSILIVNSNVKRGLVDSAYNERRQQCEQAATYFGQENLRNVSLSQLENGQTAIECILYKRARHVITENSRTLQMMAALKNEDIRKISQLMAQSHASLKHDFDVTCSETDLLVTIISEVLQQQGGVRMTGGGFGGCVVALAPQHLVASIILAVQQQYQLKTGLVADFYQCQVVNGAFINAL